MIKIATTKIWKITKRIDKVIKYIADDMKTENKVFVTGINTTFENSIRDINLTKRRFNKEDGIVGYHCYQSFKGKEVTDKEAHEIGIELANQMWGDRFQVIVTTHTNTRNTHNHFFINSVSFVDGKRLYNNKENLARLRETSDNICADNNLEVLKESKYYSSFSDSYNKKDNYANMVRKDIDIAIANSKGYSYFLTHLKNMGYEIAGNSPYEKLILRKYPYKRNIRVERSCGADYSIEMINSRIRNNTCAVEMNPFTRISGKYISYSSIANKKKVTGLKALYYHYCYKFEIFSKKQKQYLSPAQKAGLKELEHLSNQIRFITKNKINTLAELETVKKDNMENLNISKDKREKLWKKFNKTEDLQIKDTISIQIQELTDDINEYRNTIQLIREINTRHTIMINDLKYLSKNEHPQNKHPSKNLYH